MPANELKYHLSFDDDQNNEGLTLPTHPQPQPKPPSAGSLFGN